jgi:16S rRNA (cytosine967-C5)-methyltransferase
VLVRVLEDRAFADRALDAALERSDLEGRDRGLTTELVYGTLRRMIHLDFVLGTLLKEPQAKLPIAVQAALRLGAYELLHLRTAQHAAVSESVALVGPKHLRGLVNAVLRRLAGERAHLPRPQTKLGDTLAAAAIEAALPEWMLDEVAAQLGRDEAIAWAKANDAVPPVILRVNRTRTSRDELLRALAEAEVEAQAVEPEDAVQLVAGAGSPSKLPGFAEGWFSVQDPAAQLIGVLAAPKGTVALDLCAAPGGKATHLAELGAARVIAVELHAGKSRLVQSAKQRLGLDVIEVAVGDASDPAVLQRALGDTQADLVVVDAPCSGLGTLRKNPELRFRAKPDLSGLTALQDRLLDAAVKVLRPGGALVYTVCTITRAEGPERLLRFGERHPGFRLEAPESLQPYLIETGDGPCLRTWTHRHGMDGFFAARLIAPARA